MNDIKPHLVVSSAKHGLGMRLTVDVCGHNFVPRPPSKWSVEEITLHTEEVNFFVINTLFHIIIRLKTLIILKDMTLISLLNCQLQCT